MKIQSAVDPDHTTLGMTLPSEGLERILELLARQHGLRSRAYKRDALCRRVERRMRLAGFSELPDYATYLEHHPEELRTLHRNVLVGVTRFFRNRAQWEHLTEAIVPGIVRAHRDQRRPIRIWSAGCATGEEAYGLAMVFLEQLERWGSQAELQVFASDVDSEAVAIARRGIYSKDIARDVSPRRLASFFVDQGEAYQVAPQVRDAVTVSRHDLLSDPPFAWLDLIACRNVLVYLQPHVQQECLRRFHFSLLSRGVLWLGNAESVDPRSDSFQPTTPGRRTYQRLENTKRTKRPWSARTPTLDAYLTPPATHAGRALAERHPDHLVRRLERFVLARRTAACVVIDRTGHMVRQFGPTADYLVYPRGDVGPALLSWVGPDLHAKLRAELGQALERSEPTVVEGARVQRGDRTIPITCTIEPIPTVSEELWLVTFADEVEPSLAAGQAESDAEPSQQGMDPLAQRLTLELEATRAELSGVLDDLAGATQARRVGYEQLAALNEELVSTNDALESAKAEAQALNEELITLNRELAERNAQLHSVNADLELTAARSDEVRRRAESMSHASRLELEREQRHKYELIARLSHELRNPLAALAHGVTLLQHGVDPARLGMLAPLLSRQTNRMTEVLDQLLDLSRMSADDQEHEPDPEPEPP